MKNTACSRKHIDIYPPDHNGADAVDQSGIFEDSSDQALAQLVWKYFGENISDALSEVQQALTRERIKNNQISS